MPMNLKRFPKQIEAQLPDNLHDFPWARAFAAGSLLASAYLLFSGRKRAAVAIAAAAAAAAIFENPDTARELWASIPVYLRTGQDMLGRAEELVEDLAHKSEKLLKMIPKN
jgi:hypothetical protein